MEMDYTTEGSCLVVTLRGPVQMQDLMDLAKVIYAEPRFDPQMDLIMDLRQTTVQINYDQMTRLTDFLSRHPRHFRGKAAFVTDSPVTYGLTRMFENIGGDLHEAVGHFASPAEARRWLDEDRLLEAGD